MAAPKDGRLTREIKSGRMKLFDLHWDGHSITAKALMVGEKWNTEGWEFGRGATVPDAIRELFRAIDTPREDEDLI